MPAAYLNAPPLRMLSSNFECKKIPWSRKEANRLARGKAAQPFGRKPFPQTFNSAGLNAYPCEICGNGVWHTGHRL